MAAQHAHSIPHSGQPISHPEVPERHRISRWGKASFAGVIAGSLFTTVEMFLIGASGRGTIWDPIRLSASIAMGDRAIAQSTPFTFDIFFVGILMHYTLSVLYAVVLGMLVRKLKMGPSLMAGAAFGLVLYGVHFFALTPMYPWVANARSWIAVAGHLVFGVSAAWVYSRLHVQALMKQTHFPLQRSSH